MEINLPSSILFSSATIITVNSTRQIIRNGYIHVVGSRIFSVGKDSPIYPLPSNTQYHSCCGKIIIPGLINAHAHLVQSLLRGLAEDLPLHNWLCDAVWPLEAVYAENDGYNAARLTILEMLKTGTTCFLDPMLTHRAGFTNVCKAVGEMGIRGCLGKLVKFTEINRQLSITDPRDKDLLDMSMDSLFQAHRNHNGQHNGRIHVWAAAGTPRGVPISAYQELGEECSSRAVSITMHCAEAPKDLDIYRNTYGCTPMEFIEKARMTPQKGTTSSHKLVLAHMVNLDLVKDIHLLSATGTSVAHNPSSNLKLASGIAPVPAMLSASPFPVNVALGTDGAPCANHYDMFQEMHLAAILHKGFNHDATLIPAETALEMGTINGARALGLETEIGSLETGKKADLVVLDPYGRGNIGISPWDWDDEAGVSPVTTVVHGCTGRDVHITMADGQILVQDGVLVVGGRGQETEIVNKAKLAVKEILQRCNENRSEKIGGKLHSGWTYV